MSSDERLVARMRAGNEAAFATLFERYRGPLLSFCRHMLGSPEDAEDAVQLAFTNAYRDILRTDRELRVRPWLYRIARNQCITTLRNRRPQAPLEDDAPSLVGLSEEVAGREDLRALLRDLHALPTEQREALLLAELHDNSHAAVAEILGCDREKVKSLVFQARSSMIKSRRAREASCEEIQRQLSVLRGGSLRRSIVRRHLQECPACAAFRADVARQRAGLAVVLPVVPVGVLKAGAGTGLAALAKSAASAGAGASAGSAGASAGTSAALATKLGLPVAVVKGAAATIAVTTVAATGAAGVKVTRDVTRDASPPPAAEQVAPAAAGALRDDPATPVVTEPRTGPQRRKAQAGAGRARGGPPSQDAGHENQGADQGAFGRVPGTLGPAGKARQPGAMGKRPDRQTKLGSRPERKRGGTTPKRRRPERQLPSKPRRPQPVSPEDTAPLPDATVP